MSLQTRLEAFAAAVGADVKARGIPAGGTTGQILRKTSATNFAVSWATQGEFLVLTDAEALPPGTADKTVVFRYAP